jgi:hypothetical protein
VLDQNILAGGDILREFSKGWIPPTDAGAESPEEPCEAFDNQWNRKPE